MSKLKTARLVLAGVIMATVAVPASSSFAWDQRIERGTAHYVQCLDWLINDPARWSRNCQPSRPAGVMEGPSPNMTNPWIPPAAAPTEECKEDSTPSYSTFGKGKGKGKDKCDDDGHEWGGHPHFPHKPPYGHKPPVFKPHFGGFGGFPKFGGFGG